MQAVIMAGGKGTRLASVIGEIPKPMVSIFGKPLLEYQIEDLRKNGISEIIIVIGYLGNVIKQHFNCGKEFGVHITYYEEKEPLGTAGALKKIEEQLEEDFILLFGDLFLDVDFVRFVAFHKEKKANVSLFVHPNSHPYDSDILVADKSGEVTAWIYKNEERVEDYENLVNAGLYVVSREALRALPDCKKIDLEKQFITKLIPQRKIFAYRSTEYVKDVGTPERLKKVECDVANQICAKRNLKQKQKCIFLDRDGTINKHVGFLRDAAQVELEEHVAEAIRVINDSEYLAIVITNQPVIARGECSYEMLDSIHKRIHTLLGMEGAYIDALYYCPHHPDKGFVGEVPTLKLDCECRKPKVGMIKKAVEVYNIDLADSWMVGDTDIDIQTGINAGMKTGLVMTGMQKKFSKYQVTPDIKTANLLECIEQILKYERND